MAACAARSWLCPVGIASRCVRQPRAQVNHVIHRPSDNRSARDGAAIERTDRLIQHRRPRAAVGRRLIWHRARWRGEPRGADALVV
jgi:hypothetical protein